MSESTTNLSNSSSSDHIRLTRTRSLSDGATLDKTSSTACDNLSNEIDEEEFSDTPDSLDFSTTSTTTSAISSSARNVNESVTEPETINNENNKNKPSMFWMFWRSCCANVDESDNEGIHFVDNKNAN